MLFQLCKVVWCVDNMFTLLSLLKWVAYEQRCVTSEWRYRIFLRQWDRQRLWVVPSGLWLFLWGPCRLALDQSVIREYKYVRESRHENFEVNNILCQSRMCTYKMTTQQSISLSPSFLPSFLPSLPLPLSLSLSPSPYQGRSPFKR